MATTTRSSIKVKPLRKSRLKQAESCRPRLGTGFAIFIPLRNTYLDTNVRKSRSLGNRLIYPEARLATLAAAVNPENAPENAPSKRNHTLNAGRTFDEQQFGFLFAFEMIPCSMGWGLGIGHPTGSDRETKSLRTKSRAEVFLLETAVQTATEAKHAKAESVQVCLGLTCQVNASPATPGRLEAMTIPQDSASCLARRPRRKRLLANGRSVRESWNRVRCRPRRRQARRALPRGCEGEAWNQLRASKASALAGRLVGGLV